MRKILVIGFILVIAFSFVNVFQGFSTASTPKIYVEPKRNVFSTETASVGDTFTINVSTSGWEAPGLFSYEFKLYYDPTLLNVTEAKYPPGHFLPPPNFEVPINVTEANVNGYVVFAVSKLGDVPGSTGSGVLGTITFKIIKAPPPALSCNLTLKDITFLDPEGKDITVYEVEHGYYEFSPPKPPVYLKVEPATVSAREVGDEVILSVTINEMQSALKLANVTFKLYYNTTLLSTKEEWITPGGTYAHFNATVEADYVKVEVQMGTGPPFPEGKATLATIKFNATYTPPTLTTSPLHLSDVVLKDIDGNTVQYDRLEDGLYKVPVTAVKEDLNGDGKVNIEDIYVFAIAFGSYPGHPRWDPRADMDDNGRINVIDAVLIAMKFHS
jgi:hypothetical protein